MSDALNSEFVRDPLAFLRKHPVEPTGNIAGNTGISLGDMTPRMNSSNFYKHSKMHDSKRLAYLDFNQNATKGGQQVHDLVGVSGDYNASLGKVKAFFLPWRDNFVISLAIPKKGTDVRSADVRFFFTAAISGCSIFVKGSPDAPVVYHAGGDTQRTVPAQAALFWRDLVQIHAPTSGPIAGEVNKTHYVSDMTKFDENGMPKGVKSTEHSRMFEDWIKNNKGDRDLKIEEVVPTGAVMGIRDDAGDWAFYLQEYVTIYHHTFARPRFGFKKVKGATKVTARPMLLRQFYPGGFAHVNYVPSMPRALSK